MEGRKFSMLRWLQLAMLLLAFGHGTAFAVVIVNAEGIDKSELKSTSNDGGVSTGRALAKALGLPDENVIEPFSQSIDRAGAVHTRYVQKYKGIPVWNRQLVVHEDKNGEIYWVNGSAAKSLSVFFSNSRSLVPDISPVDVMSFAKGRVADAMGVSVDEVDFKDAQSELVIYAEENQVPRLAYYVNLFADSNVVGNPTRPYFLIDAITGAIIKTWEGLTTDMIGTGPGGNPKTGFYEYGAEYPYMDVVKEGPTCIMANAKQTTMNYNHTNIGPVHEFRCFRNTDEEVNGALSPLNDAHFLGGTVHDMYVSLFGSPPLAGQLTLAVHYLTDYENAFWDGSTVVFGDGKDTFYPLVALDVISHEIAHGVTEEGSGLVYYGQSGGINESFSDMAGEAAEYFERGSNDWMVGEEIFKEQGALRYMDNPPADGVSIDNAADYTEGLDVHYSSGVFNKAFYLLATSPGWDTTKAFEVMFNANRHYWVPDSTFVSAACDVIFAAQELGYNPTDVNSAFTAVGVACPAFQPVVNMTISSQSVQTFARPKDGSLWAWGRNRDGQLGDGTTIDKLTPTLVGSDTDWASMSAGSYHTVALKNDGSIWAWGQNYYGQLGDGTRTDRPTRAQVGTDVDWVSISGGFEHTIALKSNGTLWAWGANYYGQLGDGTQEMRLTPIQIGADTDWKSVTAGIYQTVAIKNDGTLWAWGSNHYGELGDGTLVDSYVPIQVGSDTDWVTVVPGTYYIVAIKSNGTLWAWGSNYYGKLGDGTTTSRYTPVQVGSDSDWMTVYPAASHTLAIKNDGTLWAWGSNTDGQLGDGTTTDRLIPVQTGTETDWVSISTGICYSVAVKSDGSVWAWGWNQYGQLGDGTTTNKLSPVLVFEDTF